MKHPLQTRVDFHIDLPLLSSQIPHCVYAYDERKTEREGGRRGREERRKGKEAITVNAVKNFLISCITSFDIITFQPFTCIEFCFISIGWGRLCVQ